MLGPLGRPKASAALALLALLSGCGSSDEPVASDRPSSTVAVERPPVERPVRRPAAQAPPSRCPSGLENCRTAEGRIVYVERVDPDGDGDAHFVIRDPQGITLPGLTAIDVRSGLRPDPLPGPGDPISAAGPVQTGTYGQSQIHAIELHVAP